MFRSFIAAAALAVAPVAVSAAQLTLAPASVIGSSGYYTACCSFQPGNIFDQQTGTVTENFGVGYWLNPDNGPVNAYITVDLGAVYNLSSVTLFNTNNGPYGDRGTGNFQIFGSNTVAGGALVGGTSLLSATLNAGANGNPAAQSFTLGGSYRYISFNPTSVSVSGTPCCGANVYGLDELQVFGAAVPEPAALSLMILGFGLVGFAARRRVATVAA
jgi:hypothetical protein